MKGASATFQCLMDRVLDDLQVFYATYLDDVVIYSESWTDHLTYIEEVLTNLKAVGLKVKTSKCKFAAA